MKRCSISSLIAIAALPTSVAVDRGNNVMDEAAVWIEVDQDQRP